MPIEPRLQQQNHHRVISVDRTAESVVVAFEDGRTVVLDADWVYDSAPASMVVIEATDDGGRALPAGYIFPTDSDPPTDAR
jgi:hypothetical protein